MSHSTCPHRHAFTYAVDRRSDFRQRSGDGERVELSLEIERWSPSEPGPMVARERLVDRYPTLPTASNPGDADRDGIGNDCDLCPRPKVEYNAPLTGVVASLKVRNIPGAEDVDHDGIGDACDNCVRTPNCQGYGDGLDPYVLGDPIDREASDCQTDADNDGIGDACAGTMLPDAAGPIGFAPDDDFDQDGLRNGADFCPRQPVTRQTCAGPGDCPDGSLCTAGVCNHRDSDLDGVGDICDNCPWSANPQQIQIGHDEEDDPDGDFVGARCEAGLACVESANPRPFGYYDRSVDGYCCVRMFDGGAVLDPHGDPVTPPASVLNGPGMGALPPGCTEEAKPLAPADGGTFCLLPQWDQDFDGVGDVCDHCPFSFDPGQETVLLDGQEVGKYCHGEFDPASSTRP